jgi:hypothetical protein
MACISFNDINEKKQFINTLKWARKVKLPCIEKLQEIVPGLRSYVDYNTNDCRDIETPRIEITVNNEVKICVGSHTVMLGGPACGYDTFEYIINYGDIPSYIKKFVEIEFDRLIHSIYTSDEDRSKELMKEAVLKRK